MNPWAPRALGDVPSALEPGYAEAILAYHDQNYRRSVELLDELLRQRPETVEFLELKALGLKTLNQDTAAIQVYADLIKLKLKQGSRSQQILAPYQFELGVLLYQKKDFARARTFLSQAVSGKFNETIARFLIGNIEFTQSRWEQAESHFEAVAQSKVPELRVASEYYLGQIAARTGNAAFASQYFYSALNHSKSALEEGASPALSDSARSAVQQILEASKKALDPFNQSRWFGNVSFLIAQDSNVLATPDSNTASGGSGRDSLKGTLQAGVGYSSTPLRSIQWVPSYRVSFTHHLNTEVQLANFLSQNLSLYMTLNALAATSYGLKLEGTYGFLNRIDQSTQKGTLKPYSLVGSFGPYFKTQISKRWSLHLEAYAQPQKNYLDAVSSDSYRRSGFEDIESLSLRSERGQRFWNPAVSLTRDSNHTQGEEFRSETFTLAFKNNYHLNSRLDAASGLSLAKAEYKQRPSRSRSDTILTLDLQGIYRWTPTWSFLASFQIINNDSNIEDVYQYDRWILSSGVSVGF